MKNYLLALCLVAVTIHCYPEPQQQGDSPGFTKLKIEEIKHLQNRDGSTTKHYRSTVAYREYDEDAYDGLDSEPESSQDRAPTLVNQNYPAAQVQLKTTIQPSANYPAQPRTNVPRVYHVQPAKPANRPLQVQQYLRRDELQDANKLEEEEKEEPDRLSLLLPQSKFTCNARNTGYYADEELGCEVFHYCQDNAKHSWVCPEGFTFHQVHLICMPPGGDNMCEKSSDFHFVNDFLYKPVNLEEYQQRPNVTLRYSDRYFPDTYRNNYRNYQDDGEEAPSNYKHSIRVTAQPRLQNAQSSLRAATIRPQATTGQVFRSPEEVNISLQQRRPIQYTTAKYIDY